MDISPINRDVIYRTRSAGSNISQYIGSTRETWILIILVHSVAACKLQHITLIYSASQFIPQQRSEKRKLTFELISSISLHFYILLSSNFSALLCQLLFLGLASKSVGLLNLHTCFRKFLTSWNITAIYRDWLYIYLCAIYRQYIGTGSTYIFVKYIGNISGLAALARYSLGGWNSKGVQH